MGFRFLGAVAAAATLACLDGGNAAQLQDAGFLGPTTSEAPPGPPSGAVPLTISPNGLSSVELTVRTDGTIFYSNADSAPHQPSSTPNPERTDCPFLNAPILLPGETFTAAVGGEPRDCKLYDYLFPEDPRLTAVVHVVPAPEPASESATDGGTVFGGAQE